MATITLLSVLQFRKFIFKFSVTVAIKGALTQFKTQKMQTLEDLVASYTASMMRN